MAKLEQQQDTHFDDDAPATHSGEILPPIRGEVSPLVAAEISQQVATAHRFPRRRDLEITNEIMGRATLDEETAAECMYSLPRAGKDITGPSIRFAELVFVSFGNLRAGARFVELDTKDPRRAAVIIEGVCLDLQSNVAQNIPTRRSIVGKKGIFGADMTNIAFAAGAAIARREAILKTVPKAIWGPAFKRVVAILQGTAATLGKRREDVLAAFKRREIPAEKVFAVMGVKSIEDITIEHMPRLFGMLTALADGSETTESLFGAAAMGGTQGGERHNPLADDAEGETVDQTTGEVTGQPMGAVKNMAEGVTIEGKAGTPGHGHPDDQHQAGPQPAQERPKAAEAPKVAEKPAQATTAHAPAGGGDRPADEAGYVQHAKAWFAAATSEPALKDRWAAERKLRTDCKVGGDAIETLTGLRDARVAELKG